MSTSRRIHEVKSARRRPGLREFLFSFKAKQIVLLLVGTLEILIGLRLMFKLIGANPENPIVTVIYGITSLFLIPFTGLVDSPTADGMILETSSIVAIVIYALLAVAYKKLIWVISSRPRSPVADVAETTINENLLSHEIKGQNE